MNTKLLTRTAILLAVALVFQLGGFPQFVTGPVVNMVLYLAALMIGMWSGVVIGIFTPVMAYIRGIMPFLPLVPFIAAGNALLVIVFALLKDKNYILGISAASVLKFFLLASAVRFIIDVPDPVAQAMSFPQLITALAGGILAMIIYKAIKASGFQL